MRRPLFGNGFTQLLRADEGVVDVFNTLDFTPQPSGPQAFAVTLFCWTWQTYAPASATPFAGQPDVVNMPAPSVSVKTDGGPSVLVNAVTVADCIALQTAQLSSMALPIKLLDRYVVRGNQQISAKNENPLCSGANSMFCFIYGYFEPVGLTLPSLPFKPLQPNEKLVAPFSAPPLVNDVVPVNTASLKTLHRLTDAYLDLVNIYVSTGGIIVGGKPVGPLGGKAAIELPNALGLPIPMAEAHPLGFMSHPFEYQPMIAPNNTNNLIVVALDSGDAGQAIMRAFGDFQRR